MTSFAPSRPLAVVAFPATGPFQRPAVRDLALMALAVVFLSAVSQVSFEVPFSQRAGEPVPVTGQTFGVLLIGVVCGLRRGLGAVLAYLAIGALGAPVYASGGSGFGALFTGATAGYLWGFVLAAAIVGWLADHGADRGPWLYASLLAGNAAIYLVGLPVLALWLSDHNVPLSVWEAGLWPFIPGDLLKLVGAAILVPGAWSLVESLRRR